ncbi:MAG: hypothetical protein AAF196_10425 [Planctomycetota bacterium]
MSNRIRHLLTGVSTGIAAVALAASVATQPPRGSVVVAPTDEAIGTNPGVDRRMQLGKKALERGNRTEALGHFEAVLGLEPSNLEALLGLVDAATDDPNRLAIAKALLASQLVDERGRLSADKDVLKLVRDGDESPEALAVAREAAVRELEKFVDKLARRGKRSVGVGVLAAWANELCVEVTAQVPLLRDRHAETFVEAVEDSQPRRKAVIEAIADLLDGNLGTAESGVAPTEEQLIARDRAARAARILTGLAAQSRFQDLEGPRPEKVDSEERRALDKIEQLRELAALEREPFTVDELRAMSEDERRSFTELHSSWGRPGRAVTPSGHYLVETICGFETLFAAAESLDHHHQRLANWIGSDPFESRQGIVRIEPEGYGLESRGAPYWWAGGFQSGDLTTVQSSWSNANALGRTLTHELTHRFDGVLYAFLPSWLVEGRAVWTGRSYSNIEDEQFKETYVPPGPMQDPFIDGYHRRGRFQGLLTGDIPDYRDNYSAGSALWTYLLSGKVDGKTVFQPRLEDYLRSMRGGRSDPVRHFEEHFCDGRDGRPSDLDGFLEEYQKFLQLCYQTAWGEEGPRREFGSLYDGNIPGPRARPLFEDRPSWSWSRSRAEPWFGQDHATAAAELLLEVGEHEAAAEAAMWALGVDGLRRVPLAYAEEALREIGNKDAAFAAASMLARRDGSWFGAQSPKSLRASLKKTIALVDALRVAADGYASTDRLRAAETHFVEAERLATLLGLELTRPEWLEDLEVLGPSDAPAETGPLSEEPSTLFGSLGLVDDRLVGFEDHRVEGLWLREESGDLTLGRSEKDNTTGGLERGAAGREVFVRDPRWIPPSRMVLKTRIQFLTSYVSGSIILGHERRDRSYRLDFTAGSYTFAIGRSEEGGEVEDVNFAVRSGYPRARYFPGGNSVFTHTFDQPARSIEVELRIDGPRVEFWIEGDFRGDWTTPDGRPVEGHIGFGVRRGAYRAQAPSMQLLGRRTAEFSQGFVLKIGHAIPELAFGGDGAMVFWVPPLESANSREAFKVQSELARIETQVLDVYPQTVAILLPATGVDLTKRIEEDFGDRVKIIRRPRGGSTGDAVTALFVDGGGVIRAGGRMDFGIPGQVLEWAKRHRREEKL